MTPMVPHPGVDTPGLPCHTEDMTEVRAVVTAILADLVEHFSTDERDDTWKLEQVKDELAGLLRASGRV